VDQYEHIFLKKSVDSKSIEFRGWANEQVTKAEKIFDNLRPFNKKRFRELFKKPVKTISGNLLMKELITRFNENYRGVKLKSKIHYRNTMNILEKFKKGLSILEITPDFLIEFETYLFNQGCSQTTVSSYMRDIRRVINYYRYEEKLLPDFYQYPFSRGGYKIATYIPEKLVLAENEIEKVISFNDFDSPEQEYALDIWKFLYRCGGINISDLVRMKWSNIHGDMIFFDRKKTETTRKNLKRQIPVSITPPLEESIEKVGVKTSPFIIGQINEEYTEQSFVNRVHKISSKMNARLGQLSKKMNLSVPLKLCTARDCFATTLRRADVSLDDIGICLGHSNSLVTRHYIGAMDNDRIKKIYSCIK